MKTLKVQLLFFMKFFGKRKKGTSDLKFKERDANRARTMGAQHDKSSCQEDFWINLSFLGKRQSILGNDFCVSSGVGHIGRKAFEGYNILTLKKARFRLSP